MPFPVLDLAFIAILTPLEMPSSRVPLDFIGLHTNSLKEVASLLVFSLNEIELFLPLCLLCVRDFFPFPPSHLCYFADCYVILRMPQ